MFSHSGMSVINFWLLVMIRWFKFNLHLYLLLDSQMLTRVVTAACVTVLLTLLFVDS